MSSAQKHEVRFDPDEESVIAVITRAVAAIQNQKHTDLKPLGEAVDVELLENAVDAKSTEAIQSAHITFTWEGTTVTLDVNGEVRLESESRR